MEKNEFHRYSATIAGAALRHDFGIPLGRMGRNAYNILEEETASNSAIRRIADRIIAIEVEVRQILSDYGAIIPRLVGLELERSFSHLSRSVSPLLREALATSRSLYIHCKNNRPDLERHAALISSGAEQALEMFGALSHFIRPGAVSEENFEGIQLAELAYQTCLSVERSDTRYRGKVKYSVQGNTKIDGIRNQLGILFQNQIANSFKYSLYPRNAGELPQVSIKIDFDYFSSYRLVYPGKFDNYSPKGEWARIVFQDNGPGVHPDEVDNIFELYVTHSQKEIGAKGTGMGLPISKLIVILHGGLLFYNQNNTEQTQFVCMLPCRHSDGISTRELVIKELAR